MCGNSNKLPLNVTNLSLDVFAGPNMVESSSVSGISRATAIYHESKHCCNMASQIMYKHRHVHIEVNIDIHAHTFIIWYLILLGCSENELTSRNKG